MACILFLIALLLASFDRRAQGLFALTIALSIVVFFVFGFYKEPHFSADPLTFISFDRVFAIALVVLLCPVVLLYAMFAPRQFFGPIDWGTLGVSVGSTLGLAYAFFRHVAAHGFDVDSFGLAWGLGLVSILVLGFPLLLGPIFLIKTKVKYPELTWRDFVPALLVGIAWSGSALFDIARASNSQNSGPLNDVNFLALSFNCLRFFSCLGLICGSLVPLPRAALERAAKPLWISGLSGTTAAITVPALCSLDLSPVLGILPLWIFAQIFDARRQGGCR